MIEAAHDPIDVGTENGEYSPSLRVECPASSHASTIKIAQRRIGLNQPRYTENWIKDAEAAKALAAVIRDHWHAKGFPMVSVWVDAIELRPSHRGGKIQIFVIRSNLVNGLPPKSSCEQRRGTARPFID